MKNISTIICLSIALIIMTASFVSAQTLEGERELPESYTSGQCIEVTINFTLINDFVLNAVVVKEEFPAGWDYQVGSASTKPDNDPVKEGKVKWLFVPRINSAVPESLSYTVCPPEEECSEAAFSGELIYKDPAIGGFSRTVIVSGDIMSRFSCDSSVMKLRPGLNFVGASYISNQGNAFEVLKSIGDESIIDSIERYNPDTKVMDIAYYENGRSAGVDFSIESGEGYFIYMNSEMTGHGLIAECPCGSTEWVLNSGKNLVSASFYQNAMTSYEILQDIGDESVVSSIQRFNTETGKFETASYKKGRVVGADFLLLPGEGYIIYMMQGKVYWP